MPESGFLSFTYLFKHPDKAEHHFEVKIDTKTMSLILPSNFKVPTWAENKKFKCNICPNIDPKHDYCHSCYNISHIVEEFKNYHSFDEINIIVKAPERRYVFTGDIQSGLMSILGLYMATSNCPVFNFLKPMARFHLPFSSLEETIFRVSSVFLLSEYFKSKRGGKPDYNLDKLVDIYEKISQANSQIIDELRSHYKNDAHSNAILILDNFSKALSILLTDHLNEIQYLFELQ